MAGADFILSKHIADKGPSARLSDRNLVGVKAEGLSRLPVGWTPPYIVIPTTEVARFGDEVAVIQEALRSSLVWQAPSKYLTSNEQRLIVRSSATIEQIECRGWLSSEICIATADALGTAIKKVISTSNEALLTNHGAAPLAVIVQHFKTARINGHLSNERRVVKSDRKWLCEIEGAIKSEQQKSRWLQAKKTTKGGRSNALACDTQKTLFDRLSDVASWCSASHFRCHIEWCWDGENLWIVQMDHDLTLEGVPPSSSSARTLFSVSPPETKVFVEATQVRGTWSKIESLRVFQAAGLPIAKLFVLEDKKAIKALMHGSVPVQIREDISQLCASPVVFRSEVSTATDEPPFMSPRSETIESPAEAIEWLKRTSAKLAADGIQPDRVCFICHRYIKARSGAFGLARPGISRVMVDSIWGLPDGLLSFPHDSFEVETSGNKNIKSRLRCKPYFLASEPSGEWKRNNCGSPWDWKPSLTDPELHEIAQQTLAIAKTLQKPVNVMFFVGVDTNTGYPELIPWIHIVDIPDNPAQANEHYYSGKSFTVTNEVDLNRLQAAIQNEKLRQKVYIRLQPSPDLLRSKPFVDKVATTAKALGVPVQLEGSVLSHIYYMLDRQGVKVRCAPNPLLETKNRRVFGKLVRDLIPVTISAKGEVPRSISVPPDQLFQMLKTKALEEAFELFWEQDSSASFEEMADVLEVIQSACKAQGRSFEDLAKLAASKREKRGGFEKGIVLLETANVPLIPSHPTLLFSDSAEPQSSLAEPRLSAFKDRRRPRRRGAQIHIPLIPPESEMDGTTFHVPVGDEIHQLVIKYDSKEVRVSLERQSPVESPNQLTLRLA